MSLCSAKAVMDEIVRLVNEHFLVGDSHGNLPLGSGEVFAQLKSMAKLSPTPKEVGLDPIN